MMKKGQTSRAFDPPRIALRLAVLLAVLVSAGSAVLLSGPPQDAGPSSPPSGTPTAAVTAEPIPASSDQPVEGFRMVLTTVEEGIPHETVKRSDPTMRVGFVQVLRKGVDGIRSTTFADGWAGGQPLDHVVYASRVLKDPVTEILRVGTTSSTAIGSWSSWAGRVAERYRQVAALLETNGSLNYRSFADNGDGTITVDGRTFTATAVSKRNLTCYDAAEWYVTSHGGLANFPEGTPIPYSGTFSGIPARRGVVATYAFRENGKWVATRLPMGTVVFVEDYGLAVVGDVHHVTSDIERIDCAYDPREVLDTYHLGVRKRRVYILAWP
jgi:hypothetical protein